MLSGIQALKQIMEILKSVSPAERIPTLNLLYDYEMASIGTEPPPKKTEPEPKPKPTKRRQGRPRGPLGKSPAKPVHLTAGPKYRPRWDSLEGRSFHNLRVNYPAVTGIMHRLDNGTRIIWLNSYGLIAFPKDGEPFYIRSAVQPKAMDELDAFEGRVALEPLRKNIKEWFKGLVRRKMKEQNKSLYDLAKEWDLNSGSTFRYMNTAEVPALCTLARVCRREGMPLENLLTLLTTKDHTVAQ